MKLTLIGHDDRYAVEQLQMALFSPDAPGEAVSSLHRGKIWLTASAKITLDGKTARAVRRMKIQDETVRDRRRILQQSYYLAACALLPQTPPWGALAGVRPTKISTRHLLEGGSAASADKLLEKVYYVTPDRRKLAVDCSISTVHAAKLLSPNDISLYVGIPFCPTRCSYCSFVSRTIGKRTELIAPYLEALLQDVFVGGEHGKHDSARMIITTRKPSLKTYLLELHRQMKRRFRKLGDIWILWPILWLLTGFFFVYNNIALRNVSTKKILESNKERSKLVQKLDVFTEK